MSSLGRSRIVVASSSEVMLQSLWRTTQVLCMGQQDAFEFSSNGYDNSKYPNDYAGAVHAAGTEAIASFLDALPAETIRRTLCILDLSSESTPKWRIEEDMHSLRPTRLAARFPEVYWIFIVRDGTVPENIAKDAQEMHFVALDKLSKLKKLLSRHAGGFRPWFDPSNLRASALLDSNCGASCLDVRLQGLVFDEETTFAAFNSYFLYRQGIPTRMVATKAEYDEVKDLDGSNRKYVILEDVELNFGDIELGSENNKKVEIKNLFLPEPNETAIESSLKKRLESWGVENQDKTISARVFVSTSRLGGDRKSVVKPFGGLYDRTLLHLSTVKGDSIASENTSTVSGHSAPGAQQAVAAKLLERVRILHTAANDTVSAVHAALLALEAERLLEHKTYAMSIEALSERHVLEAVAECAFEGAADDLEVRKRTDELQAEVVRLVFKCTSGHAEDVVISLLMPSVADVQDNRKKLYKRLVQLSNGMLECVGRLREIYQRFGKVEEEEVALRKIRCWRLAVFLLKRSFSEKLIGCLPSKFSEGSLAKRILGAVNILELTGRLVCGIPMAYISLVLHPLILIGAIFSWVLLFACLFQGLSVTDGLPGTEFWTYGDWFRHSFITFVSLQPGDFGNPNVTDMKATAEAFPRFWELTAWEMALGYLHLPIFVTWLIQKFNRR